MRIFAWGYQPRHEHNAGSITRHRWALNCGTWRRGVYVSIDHEIEDSAEWRPGVHYFTASLMPEFQWGAQHDYYDGPHCSFSLGILRLSWSYWWCRKCMPDTDNKPEEASR